MKKVLVWFAAIQLIVACGGESNNSMQSIGSEPDTNDVYTRIIADLTDSLTKIRKAIKSDFGRMTCPSGSGNKHILDMCDANVSTWMNCVEANPSSIQCFLIAEKSIATGIYSLSVITLGLQNYTVKRNSISKVGGNVNVTYNADSNIIYLEMKVDSISNQTDLRLNSMVEKVEFQIGVGIPPVFLDNGDPVEVDNGTAFQVRVQIGTGNRTPKTKIILNNANTKSIYNEE